MYLSVFAICSKEKADFNNFEKLIFSPIIFFMLRNVAAYISHCTISELKRVIIFI